MHVLLSPADPENVMLKPASSLTVVLLAAVLFLGYRVYRLEESLAQTQRNTAIAVLSAEAANKKVGAIAPYFAPDKDAFEKAWLDTVNMPLAEFPEDVLVPLQQELAAKRSDPVSRELAEETF